MQNKLADFAKTVDNRTSLFDVQVETMTDGVLVLSGRVLDASQLDELARIVSTTLNAGFPDRKLDTASIRILNAETHPRLHVATNLTGLYEKPTFGMPLSSELYFGTPLEVLDESGNWVFVRQADGYLGWVYRRYLSEETPPAPTHLVLAPSMEVREKPDETSAVVTRLVSGTGVAVTETRNGWSRVEANKSGWLPSRHLRAVTDIPQSVEARRAALVEDAQRMIGVPYLWGGVSGNGIDCSGFVRLLHRWIGLEVPRDADMQCNAARPVAPPFEIGDLFFFGDSGSARKVTHVGMSLGGWTVIHSSRKNNGVYVDDLQKADFLRESYLGAGSFLRASPLVE